MERHRGTKLLLSPSLVAPISPMELAPLPLELSPYVAMDPPPSLGYGGVNLAEMSQSQHMEFLASKDPIREVKAPKLEAVSGGSQSSLWSKVFVPAGFQQLPELQSLEPDPVPVEKSLDPLRCFGDLQSIIEHSQRRFQSTPHPSSPAPPLLLAPPRSELLRRRRRGIGDRIQALRALIPSGERMDTSKILEKARVYVRFLEAQVTALQSMPLDATGFVPSTKHPGGTGMAGLDGLNRQQLLRVLMSSAPAQEVLCQRGWCVFSIEQLVALRQAVARCPQLLAVPQSNH